MYVYNSSTLERYLLVKVGVTCTVVTLFKSSNTGLIWPCKALHTYRYCVTHMCKA